MEYAGKVSGFCISACLGCWEVEFLVRFWISDLKVTAGIFQNCTFRVSGSVKPHRGLVFFLSKKYEPHPVVCYLRHPESQNYTLYLLIF